MNFAEYHILNEAGFQDRVKFLAQKFQRLWNLRCMEMANVHIFNSGFIGVEGLEEDIARLMTPHMSPDQLDSIHDQLGFLGRMSNKFSPDENDHYDELDNVTAVASLLKSDPNQYWLREGNNSPQDKAFWKITKKVWEFLDHYINEYNRNIDHHIQDGKQSWDISFEFFEQFGRPRDLNDIEKEFKDIARVADPIVVHSIREGIPIERTKPVYLEWILLSFIDSDWEHRMDEHWEGGYEWTLRDNWGSFEDLHNIRQILHKHWYYTTRTKRQIKGHLQMSNQGYDIDRRPDGHDELIHDGHYTPSNPFDISQFTPTMVYDRIHRSQGHTSRLEGLERYVDEFEDAYPNAVMPNQELKEKSYKEIPGTELVGENDEFVALKLVDFNASTIVCAGMGWCITDEGTFNSYSNDSPLYAFATKDGDRVGKVKYLLHSDSQQAKAKHNQTMDEDAIEDIIDIVVTLPDMKAMLDAGVKGAGTEDEVELYATEWSKMFHNMEQGMDKVLNVFIGDHKVREQNPRVGATTQEIFDMTKMLVDGNKQIHGIAYNAWYIEALKLQSMKGHAYDAEWQIWIGALRGEFTMRHESLQADPILNLVVKKTAGWQSGKAPGAPQEVQSEITTEELADNLLKDPKFVYMIWYRNWLDVFAQEAKRDPSGMAGRPGDVGVHAGGVGSSLSDPLETFTRNLQLRTSNVGYNDFSNWILYIRSQQGGREYKILMDRVKLMTNRASVQQITDKYLESVYGPWRDNILHKYFPSYRNQDTWMKGGFVSSKGDLNAKQGVLLCLLNGGLIENVKPLMIKSPDFQRIVDVLNLKGNIIKMQ